MNDFGLKIGSMVVILSLHLWGQTPVSDAKLAFVQDRVRTNALETWEGEYSVSGVYPLPCPWRNDNLFLCVYSCRQTEGNLAELYSVTSQSAIRKVLPANVNVKGVTPRIEAFGCRTNSPNETYWVRWRHPGNGGYLTYDSYTDGGGILLLTNKLEYCDIGNGKSWYVVDPNENYQETTNLNQHGVLILWQMKDN